MDKPFYFSISKRLPQSGKGLGKDGKRYGRSGVIHTPHGIIRTPAFIPVATQAAIKGVLPEKMEELGAQALLANAFHLHERPGEEVIDKLGGIGKFMNWPHPTYTDSGGFQVLSLGAGFKKVLAMDVSSLSKEEVVAANSERRAFVDEDGVDFKSPLNGSKERFSAEISIGIQHKIGADVIFTFDELTTLVDPRSYQEQSLQRTFNWAKRCVAEHERLTEERKGKPYQALFGVIQGANYEDLRRTAAKQISGLNVDGFGIGGALEKKILGQICAWIADELPEDKPVHVLGIAAVDDVFAGVENGGDTFDCVLPARCGRNGAIYTHFGRYNVTRSSFLYDSRPLEEGCGCYACTHYSRAYIRHLLRCKEMNGSTLATIHNEYFFIHLLNEIRASIEGEYFDEFKESALRHFYGF